MSWFIRLIGVFLLVVVTASFPEAGRSEISRSFSVPKRLAPRVQFWVNVFTKYGKHQIVVHHKRYPQIVFGVVDVSVEAGFLSDVKLAKLRAERVKGATSQVKQALRTLARGGSPGNRVGQRVKTSMERYGRGKASDYKAVLNDDLIRTQTGIKEKFEESIRRSGRYLPRMEEIFRKRGLPIELTRLPFVESSFDYRAYSSVGAAGIWQFMRRTAAKYMRINQIVDERRDPLVATEAAAKYLGDAYKRLGSWPLAITSYNHGVAGVSRKAKSARSRDIVELIEGQHVFGFASNNFFPEFLAAILVYRNYRDYFPGVEIESPERYVSRRLPYSMSINRLATYYGVSVEDLKGVNYSFSSKVWTGRRAVPKGYLVKIPLVRGKKAPAVQLVSNKTGGAVSPGFSTVKPSKVVHIVRRGENLSRIASRYRVTVRQLMTRNGLKSSVVRPGQRLVVSASGGGAVQTVGKSPRLLKYRVRRGDTLSGIAKKFGTRSATLVKVNGLRSNLIRVGETLKVPTSSGGKPSQPAALYHTVGLGDSLWTVAKRYRTTIAKIKRLSKIRSNTLRVGQRLRVR